MTLPSDDEIGAGLVAALARPSSYVSRRVETIRFTSDGQARRHVSLDLDLRRIERLFPSVADGLKQAPVVLALLRKEPLALLDVRSDEGRSLSILNTQDNGRLAFIALQAHARMVLGIEPGGALSSTLLDILEDVARKPTPEARLAFGLLTTSENEECISLSSDLPFIKMLGDFTESFMLATQVSCNKDSSQRMVLKFSYASDFDLGNSGAWSSIKRVFFNAAEFNVVVPVPSVTDAASYHVQVVAPPGLQVGLPVLRIYGVSRTADGDLRTVSGGSRGNVSYVNLRAPLPGSRAELHLKLAATARGIVSAAALSAILATLMLAGLAFVPENKLDALQGQADASLVLLVGIPTLVSAYLARPGEPNVVSRVLGVTRCWLILSALTLLVSGSLIVLGLDGQWYFLIVRVCLLFSVACTASLLLAWRRCRNLNNPKWKVI